MKNVNWRDRSFLKLQTRLGDRNKEAAAREEHSINAEIASHLGVDFGPWHQDLRT